MHVWTWSTGLSLTHGVVHVGLIAAAVLGLAGLLALRHDRTWWTRLVPSAVLVAAALVGVLLIVLAVTKPWPDALPVPVLVWIGVALLGLALLVVGWRGQRWSVRLLAPIAVALVVLGAADGIDTVFGAYPTVASALQLQPYDDVSGALLPQSQSEPGAAGVAPPAIQQWQPPPDMPANGGVTQVTIPATRSGFAARPAWVYLPPAALTAHPPLLPVLVMIGGQPGSPRDWLDGGQLAQQMDQWAATHAGLTPIVVMPDGLGSQTANPLCMDSALGKADTYLSSDVVSWATSSLPVDPDHRHWAVGGFSYGGTCALQLAVAHPDLFPTFFDVSGQKSPTLGGRTRTLAATFGGDARAFATVDPLRELARHPEPNSAGYIAVGAQDDQYRSQELAVTAAARDAGMAITYRELPGRHSWDVWRPAFAGALPWLSARMGLAP